MGFDNNSIAPQALSDPTLYVWSQNT